MVLEAAVKPFLVVGLRDVFGCALGALVIGAMLIGAAVQDIRTWWRRRKRPPTP